MTETIEILEMHPVRLELPADAPPEPPALPGRAPQETTPLMGRARLQAAIDQATSGPVRRLPTKQAGQPGQQGTSTAAQPSSESNEVFFAMFQTEGWAAFRGLLKRREEGYLVRLRNPVSTIEEVRICQGALFELQLLLAEEQRIRTLANKTPPALPVDLSAVQEGRAP